MLDGDGPSVTPEEFLRDLPVLHRRGGREHAGGLNPRLGQVFIDHLGALDRPRMIETGSGASTIFFFLLGCSAVTAINPDPDIEARIREAAAERGVDTSGLTCIQERSETALPKLAADGTTCDAAFIDGNHGWPSVFVDFCYLNMMLRKGGLLFVDDVHIYACSQLLLLLTNQPEYELLSVVGKVAAFRKRTAARFLPDWRDEPFIAMNTTNVRVHSVGKPGEA